jgi:DNA-directed RNA polymerase subunit RPC12/RpoP
MLPLQQLSLFDVTQPYRIELGETVEKITLLKKCPLCGKPYDMLVGGFISRGSPESPEGQARVLVCPECGHR